MFEKPIEKMFERMDAFLMKEVIKVTFLKLIINYIFFRTWRNCAKV